MHFYWDPPIPPHRSQSPVPEHLLKLWSATPEFIRDKYHHLTASGTYTTLLYTSSSAIESLNPANEGHNPIRVPTGSTVTKQDHASTPSDQAMYDATLTVARDTTHSPALPRDATVPDLYSHLPRHLATENETALSTSPSSTESPLFESPHHSSPDLHSLPDGRNALPILGGEDVHAHAEFVDPVPCEDGCPPKSESLREPDEDVCTLFFFIVRGVDLLRSRSLSSRFMSPRKFWKISLVHLCRSLPFRLLAPSSRRHCPHINLLLPMPSRTSSGRQSQSCPHTQMCPL